MAQRLKRLPPVRETWVRSLGREDPLEKEMATHSSILAWKIPWTEDEVVSGRESASGLLWGMRGGWACCSPHPQDPVMAADCLWHLSVRIKSL